MAAHRNAYRKKSATGWADWLQMLSPAAASPELIPLATGTLPRSVWVGRSGCCWWEEWDAAGRPARPSSAADSSSA